MAPEPGSSPLRPVLQAGDLLAGRYRLERDVPCGLQVVSPASLWLASDEVLGRPVAAKVLAAGGQDGATAARPFLEAAAHAGALAHPVLARVYDAAIEARPAAHSGRPAVEVDVAYVISEWVDGPNLAQALDEDGPWEFPPAVVLTERLADALHLAHGQGLLHGRLHPGNVLLTPDGGVKLTDLSVSAALPGRRPPSVASEDARDLAVLLYAALTARWPVQVTTQPGAGLPAAPAGRDSTSGVRLTSPAQVRAGVPRALDSVVMRALNPAQAAAAPALTSVEGLATVVAGAAPVESSGDVAGSRPPRLPPWVRRWLPVTAITVVLVAIGGTFYSMGTTVGSVDPPRDRLAALAPPAPGTSAPASVPANEISLAAATVTDFDPPPGDSRERPGSLANTYDGDLTTVWETERYASAAFGGLKPGVGLLVDLAGPTALGKVELALEAPDTAVELRVADTASTGLSGYRVVAAGRSSPDGLVLTAPPGTAARYVLLWITSLPQVDGRFVAGIAEMRLSGP